MSTLNKSQLVDAVSNDVDATKKLVAEVLDSVLEHVVNSLTSGNDVALKNFCTFKVKDRKKIGFIVNNRKSLIKAILNKKLKSKIKTQSDNFASKISASFSFLLFCFQRYASIPPFISSCIAVQPKIKP